MLLKVITTALVLTGIAMLIGFPFLTGNRPTEGSDAELARYGARLLAYFGVTCIAWLGAAVCAIILVRRTRKEFAESQKEIMRGLVEGTLRDHGRKR